MIFIDQEVSVQGDDVPMLEVALIGLILGSLKSFHWVSYW